MPTNRIPEAAYDLGALCEDFRVSRSELYQSLLFIPFAIGMFVLMTLVRMPKLLAPGNVVEWTMAVGGTLFLGGFLVSGILIIRRTFAQRHLRVLLFEDGLVYFHRDGVDVCRWDEIEWTADHYVQDGPGAIRRLSVRSPGGQLIFDQRTVPMNDFDGMVESIDRRIAEQRLAKALADLSAGKTCDFGRIQLSEEGVACDDCLLPWSQLKRIHPDGCYVNIEQSNSDTPWAHVPFADICDKRLLIELAAQVSRSRECTVAG